MFQLDIARAYIIQNRLIFCLVLGKISSIKRVYLDEKWVREVLGTNTLKGVAQPYLSLWELSRELQQRDKAETFQDCRVDLGGELP